MLDKSSSSTNHSIGAKMLNMSVLASLSPYPCCSVLEDGVGTYSLSVSNIKISTIFYKYIQELSRHYRILVNTSMDDKRMPSSTELHKMASKASTFGNMEMGEVSQISNASSTWYMFGVARLLMSTKPSTMGS